MRGGVFVGVDKTRGDFAELGDAATGALAMRDWAVSQGEMDSALAIAVTDKPGADGRRPAVRMDDICTAVEQLIAANVGHLFLYFGGHGLFLRNDEQWLLSHAPDRQNEAVSLAETVACAQLGRVPFVTIISDACRTTASGAAVNVDGGSVFPNDPLASAREQCVDQFLACRFGQSAAEVPGSPAGPTRVALYTSTLLDLLRGSPDFFEPNAETPDGHRYLWSYKLNAVLEQAIKNRVRQAEWRGLVNQQPVARTSAQTTAWFARRSQTPGAVPRGTGRRGVEVQGVLGNQLDGFEIRNGALVPTAPLSDLANLSRVAQVLMASVVDFPERWRNLLAEVAQSPAPGAGKLVATAERILGAAVPRPAGAAIAVYGAEVVDRQPDNAVVPIDSSHAASDLDSGPTTVAVRLRHASAEFVAVIPLLPNHLACLTFERDQLVDIDHRPDEATQAGRAYRTREDELRALRAIFASCLGHGMLRLDGVSLDTLAQCIRYGPHVDPTLAIYAAYGYFDLGLTDEIARLGDEMATQTSTHYFDLELLAGKLRGMAHASRQFAPFVPILSRGWPVARANQVPGLDILQALKPYLRDSPWSLFDAGATDIIMQGISLERWR